MTVQQVAFALIPLLLGVIGFLIVRALNQYDKSAKSYDDKLQANTNMMETLSQSVNMLRLEITKVSLNNDSYRQRFDEKFVEVADHLIVNDLTLNKHADWLQRHEIEITKLKINEKI